MFSKIQDYFIISSEKLSNNKVLLRFSSKHHSEQSSDFLECLSGEYCTTLSKSDFLECLSSEYCTTLSKSDFLECLSGEYCTTLSKSTETIWCTISFNVEQDEYNYVQHDYIMKIMKPCQAHIQP